MRSLTAILVAAGCGLARLAQADALYHEAHRPQFHFSPPQQWMNDPNGMVYDHGEYHLFYQYNPYSNKWGPMHWGHAVSRDTVSWENLPIALYPDRNGTIFSGSAVLDSANTSKFGTKGKPALVAMFTYHDHLSENLGHTGFQSQGIAYSLDNGRNWVKYPGNPVLTSPNVRDFRDPKVFWHAPSRKWIVALAVADHVAIYASPDLTHWTHESDFGQGLGSHGGVWECPDLIAMTVEGTAAHKYVLMVSIGKGGPNGGSATQYFVGAFDGHQFTLDADQAARLQTSPLWVDYGTDDYAGSTWFGGPADEDRPRFLGWMSNWQYATVVPTERWRSAMTLPRELRLANTDRGLELHSLPAAELTLLHQRAAVIAAQTVSAPLDLTQAAAVKGHLLELVLELDTRAADLAELTFANSKGEATVFRVNRKERRYELDRRTSGAVDFHPVFANLETAPLRGTGEHVALHVFLDESSLEVFINNGETVMTAIVFPTTPYDAVTLKADRDIGLGVATVYELKSIWNP